MYIKPAPEGETVKSADKVHILQKKKRRCHSDFASNCTRKKENSE